MGWPWQRKEKQAEGEPRLEPLSDRKYEQLFLALLDDVAAGKSPEQIRARLGERRNDRSFVSWLRRYGQKLLQQPVDNVELASRMVELGAAELGELSVVAKEIGERLLVKAAEPPPERPMEEEPPKAETADRAESSQTAKGNAQIEFYWQQGTEAYFRGDFRGAITAFDQVLSIKPDLHEVLSNKGSSLANLGRYEDAIAAYDQALAIKPDLHGALSNKGSSLDNLGRYEDAIAAYDQALAIKPDLHGALSNKGSSLNNLGRYEDAITAYDQALAIKPDLHEALYNKGSSLANLGRYEDAVAAYDQALAIKPDLHGALSNKGISLDNLGRYEDVIAAYDQALAIKPNLHEALSNKGASLANLGQYEDAVTAYDQALVIKPDLHEAWLNRGIAASNSLTCVTPVVFSLPISLQHPSLDQRGYEGQLACYAIGLRHVPKNENPEGWGLLHHQTGRAHYFYGRFLPQAHLYLSQAASSYQSALTTLPAFPARHLDALADAIRAYLGLGDMEMIKQYRKQGLEVFRQLLNNASTPARKQQLERQFSSFSQLQVDSLIRETNPITALETAERYKNRTLTWILDTWQEQITSPSWADMQTLLAPNTAAIYWHLSPDSLTTFLLTADAAEPQVAFVQSTAQLEPWLKKWNRQYQNYRGKGKAVEANKDLDAWRTDLKSSLNELKEILQISKLTDALKNVSQLLLVPHRDLHRLPLHTLFSEHLTATYLPSLQVGLNLKRRAVPSVPRPEMPLLTVADPRGGYTPRLESAEIEATLISLLFEQVDTVESNNATTQTLTAKLSQPNRIFNFSGHAWAERQPKQSALYLKDEERLTAEAICQLNLKSYDLITLSACETAVTGLQTIESDYVGLVSAFLTAGAANIVSTLWTVESESNAWLMVKFYQHYVDGASPAVALQKAQRWLRTLTYAELIHWLQPQYEKLAAQSSRGENDGLNAYIGRIRANPSKMNSTQPPYADPYYWAAFTVTGYSQ